MSEEVKQEPELELTDAQKDAVYTIDKNVAVSAGAGAPAAESKAKYGVPLSRQR